MTISEGTQRREVWCVKYGRENNQLRNKRKLFFFGHQSFALRNLSLQKYNTNSEERVSLGRYQLEHIWSDKCRTSISMQIILVFSLIEFAERSGIIVHC